MKITKRNLITSLQMITTSIVFNMSQGLLYAETEVENPQENTSPTPNNTATEVLGEVCEVVSKEKNIFDKDPNNFEAKKFLSREVKIPLDTFFQKAPKGFGDKVSKLELHPCPHCVQKSKKLKMILEDGTVITYFVSPEYLEGIPFSKEKGQNPIILDKASSEALPNIDGAYTGDENLKILIKKLMLKKRLALRLNNCDKLSKGALSIDASLESLRKSSPTKVAVPNQEKSLDKNSKTDHEATR